MPTHLAVTAEGFLAQLDPQIGREMDRRMRRLHVRKGQIVIEQGSTGSDVYCVLNGEFDVMVYSPNGRQVYLRKISAGAIFGEYSALDGGRRSATVVAASDAQVAVLSRSDFSECLRTSSKASLWLANQLALQTRELTERIFELSALNVRSRLHCELMRLAMVAGVVANRAVVEPTPTHAELASRIGTHREAITREMNDLAHMNVLAQKQRRLEILDIARLSQMVQATGGDIVSTVPHVMRDEQE